MPDCDGAGKAALRPFFLRQDRYERDGNCSGLHDAAPVDLLRHAKYGEAFDALMNDAVAAASADYPVDRTAVAMTSWGITPLYRVRARARWAGVGAASAPSGFGLAGQTHPKACLRG